MTGASRPLRRRSSWVAAVLGVAVAAAIAAPGCIVRRFTGAQLTGTCDGACAHYAQCKPGHSEGDRRRCLEECPNVFSDRDSLMAYESLTCDDAVEYIDGSVAKTAEHRP